MDLGQLTYLGPSLDDVEILPRLPPAYVRFLASRNGFVAFGGGLHVRGAVLDPEWHSIRAALEGPSAPHVLFDALTPADVPFAQDALGDQFILRDGLVYRLHGEAGNLQPLQVDFVSFLERCAANPVDYLSLQPLLTFQAQGGKLTPGQLLSVYPPFLIDTGKSERSYAAVPAIQVLTSLGRFASEVRDLPDGTKVKIKVPDKDGA